VSNPGTHSTTFPRSHPQPPTTGVTARSVTHPIHHASSSIQSALYLDHHQLRPAAHSLLQQRPDTRAEEHSDKLRLAFSRSTPRQSCIAADLSAAPPRIHNLVLTVPVVPLGLGNHHPPSSSSLILSPQSPENFLGPITRHTTPAPWRPSSISPRRRSSSRSSSRGRTTGAKSRSKGRRTRRSCVRYTTMGRA
jgi:hypothetical protein